MNNNSFWEKDPRNKEYENCANFKSPDGFWTVSVRRDGCMDFVKYWNQPDGEDYDTLHICDIDDHIEMLQALKKKAIEHFGTQWPE